VVWIVARVVIVTAAGTYSCLVMPVAATEAAGVEGGVPEAAVLLNGKGGPCLSCGCLYVWGSFGVVLRFGVVGFGGVVSNHSSSSSRYGAMRERQPCLAVRQEEDLPQTRCCAAGRGSPSDKVLSSCSMMWTGWGLVGGRLKRGKD